MGKVFDIEYMISTVPEILKYLPVTLEIALYSGIISLILGFAVALIRTFKVQVL